jgi:predicted aldo/keto reductase-like oxidoreductase
MTHHHSIDGKKVSLLGYGAMRLPTIDGGHANNWAAGVSEKSIDQQAFDRQIKYMLDNGINYFDTSPVYCRGESEKCLGLALSRSGYDRSKYIIATKLSNFSPTHYSLDACKGMFEKSLKALRTDYIDNYLLHSVGSGGMKVFSMRYLDNGALDWCMELRKQGRIRNLGFSFHGDPKVFEWCVENHSRIKWDFCLIQMNYVDWEHATQINKNNLNARYLYEKLTELKIPVAIMEPMLGGRLARYNWAIANELKALDPDASLAKWALRFCGSFENVMTVLSGMTYSAHIEENIATYSPLKPCTADEFAALERAARAMLSLNTIPCNRCDYCMPCPYGLDIPGILTFRNEILAAKEKFSARRILKLYRQRIPEALRRAEHCTGCGRCNSHCPQQIDIPKTIAEIDAWIGELKNSLV